MGKTSRDKGAAGERELARLLLDELGVRLVRRLDQSRSGGFDLEPAPGEVGEVADYLWRCSIEVKRHAKASPGLLWDWWDQAEAQAEGEQIPVLAYRSDRAAWRFRLPLWALHSGMTRAPGADYAADLSLHGFCAAVRELAWAK